MCGKQTDTSVLPNSVANWPSRWAELKQTLEEMAKVWDDLARREDKRDEPGAE